VQTQLAAVESERDQVKQYNLALQEQVSKYATLSMEEKNEKKERISKYETLQAAMQQEQQGFYARALQAARKQYFLTGLCAAMAIAIILLLWLHFNPYQS